ESLEFHLLASPDHAVCAVCSYQPFALMQLVTAVLRHHEPDAITGLLDRSHFGTEGNGKKRAAGEIIQDDPGQLELLGLKPKRVFHKIGNRVEVEGPEHTVLGRAVLDGRRFQALSDQLL